MHFDMLSQIYIYKDVPNTYQTLNTKEMASH